MGKWDNQWKESDQTHDNWGRSNSSRADDFTSKSGDGSSHCHLWHNIEKEEIGVVHRGDCKVCDDEKSSSANSKSSQNNEKDSEDNGDGSGGK